MILLDTDHASHLFYHSSQVGARIRDRLAASGAVVALSIITAEELIRGRLLAVSQQPQVVRQVRPYAELATTLGLITQFPTLPFDQPAADRFAAMGRIRVSAMDRKIASIALARNCLLLTANRRDFAQVPGLNFADWSA